MDPIQSWLIFLWGLLGAAEDYLRHSNLSNKRLRLIQMIRIYYSELGNIFSKAGDLPAAQAAYESAIQLSPQDPLFYCLLAQFALDNQIQIHALALPAARQAILLDPHNANSLDVMAQVMFMLEDYHSAERYVIRCDWIRSRVCARLPAPGYSVPLSESNPTWPISG